MAAKIWRGPRRVGFGIQKVPILAKNSSISFGLQINDISITAKIQNGSQNSEKYRFHLSCQTSRSNKRKVISTFKFGYPRLSLKEGPKVKSEDIKRFLAHDILLVGFTLQTSRVKNK